MSEILKVCPICGGEGKLKVRGNAAGVQCRSKTHLIWSYGKTADAAITAWNKRTG